MAKTNGTPAWYTRILQALSTSQAEIFALHGDVEGYPVNPMETLPDFLERASLSRVLAQAKTDSTLTDSEVVRRVADSHVVARLSLSDGLAMAPAMKEAFERWSPPPESPWAAPGLDGDLKRVSIYLRDAVQPLTLIVYDADLLFDAGAPMVDPEKVFLSYLRRWAEKPLTAQDGMPHRIYLIARTQKGLRPALLQGRIMPISIPLPDATQRRRFLQLLLDSPDTTEKGLKFVDGLTPDELARITGALNLVQLEDVVYQALSENGKLTRVMAQKRKDELVAQVYGGVLQIEYPNLTWDDIVGYEPLKQYLRGYVWPKLKANSPSCPKGCIFTGPPGCLDADTPIFDPQEGSTRTVLQRWQDGRAFHVHALDHATGRLVVARAEAPYEYAPAEMFRVMLQSGASFAVTGGHLLWTGQTYESVDALAARLRGCVSVPLPTIAAPALAVSPADASRSTHTAPDSPAGHPTRHRSDDGPLRQEASVAPSALPSPVDSGTRTHSGAPVDGPVGGAAPADPRASLHPATSSSATPTAPEPATGWAPPLCAMRFAQSPSSSPAPAPSQTRPLDVGRRLPVSLVAPRPIFDADCAVASVGPPPGNVGGSSPRPPETPRRAGRFPIETTRTMPSAALPHQEGVSDSTPSRVPCSVRLLASGPPSALWQVDQIIRIESVGRKSYYDFHVPGHENYWACGFIHHNTGKTALARVIAAALGLPLVVVRMDLVKNMFVGESNKNMARLCEGIVALAPAIVLLDEIDKIMPESGDSSGVSQELLGQLQSFMSDIPRGTAFFIGTTNYPKRIPPALLRPGRFEEVLPLLPQHLDDATGALRGKVLQSLSKRLRLTMDQDMSPADYACVGKGAVGYTGADLEKLLIEADREATEAERTAITRGDLETALQYIVPTLASTQPMVDQALASCTNRRYVPESMRALAGVTPSDPTEDAPKGRRIRNLND